MFGTVVWTNRAKMPEITDQSSLLYHAMRDAGMYIPHFLRPYRKDLLNGDSSDESWYTKRTSLSLQEAAPSSPSLGRSSTSGSPSPWRRGPSKVAPTEGEASFTVK